MNQQKPGNQNPGQKPANAPNPGQQKPAGGGQNPNQRPAGGQKPSGNR